MSEEKVRKDLDFLTKMKSKRMGHKWHHGRFVRVAYINKGDSLKAITDVIKKIGFSGTIHIYRDTDVFKAATLPYEVVIGTNHTNCEVNVIGSTKLMNDEMFDCPVIEIPNGTYLSGQGSIFLEYGLNKGIKIRKNTYEDHYGDIFRYFVLKYQHTLMKFFENQGIINKSYGLIKATSMIAPKNYKIFGAEERREVKNTKIRSYLKTPRYGIVQEKVDILPMSVEEAKANKRRVDKIVKNFCGFRCWNRDPKPDSFGLDSIGRVVMYDIDQFISLLTIVEMKEPAHGPRYDIHSTITKPINKSELMKSKMQKFKDAMNDKA